GRDLLFCATRDNKLWVRRPVLENIPWREIGHALGAVAMTSVRDQLFLITRDGRLWMRPPVLQDVPWQEIGRFDGATALSSNHGWLFIVAQDNELWARPAGAEQEIRRPEWWRYRRPPGLRP